MDTGVGGMFYKTIQAIRNHLQLNVMRFHGSLHITFSLGIASGGYNPTPSPNITFSD